MDNETVHIKLDFLRKRISRFFDIDESFVNISEIKKSGEKISYQFEIKIETPVKDLRTIHLRVYSFSVIPVDSAKFIYENEYYIYDNLNPFLEKLAYQIDELNKDN